MKTSGQGSEAPAKTQPWVFSSLIKVGEEPSTQTFHQSVSAATFLED